MLVRFYRSLSIDDLRVLQFCEKRGAVDVGRVNDVKFAAIDLYKRQMLGAVAGHFETFDSRPGMVDNRQSGPDRPCHRSTIDFMRYACPKECSTRPD